MKSFFIVILFAIFLKTNVQAQLQVPGLEKFRAVMSNCSMEYTMQCIYPGGQEYTAKGVIAVQGDKFYDSSNMRYVFKDSSWYIIADHLEQVVSVAYLEELNKQWEGVGTITPTSYLLDDNIFNTLARIDVIKQNSDTSWLSIHFKDSSMIERLEIQTLRKNFQPIAYNALINYPIGGYEDGDPVVIKLNIDCYNIVSPAPAELFDVRRLISVKGKVATLKKFAKYKTYK